MTGLSTDNFIHARDELLVHVTCLLNCIFIHGSVPDDFVVGTTIPIPKNKNVNVARSENYRGITPSSVFGRILDNIIMRRYVSLLASCVRLQTRTVHCYVHCCRQLSFSVLYTAS
jgi:hypothetical protein